MSGRRGVKNGEPGSRETVHDAKTALGERGDPWWEPTADGTRRRLAATIRTLLRGRDGASICPSDAARVVGGEQWRDLMDPARSVAYAMRDRGDVTVTQKGRAIETGEARGPIRIVAGSDLRTDRSG